MTELRREGVQRVEREGRAYIRPVRRGVYFCADEAYLEDIVQKLNGGCDGYGHLRIVIEWTFEGPQP